MKTENSLESLFRPKSVAIIGASSRPRTLGWEILRNVIKSGFKGEIYPVNPKADIILKQRVYKNIDDIDGDVELAIIVIPRDMVTTAAGDCARKGVKGLIVITAGFKEVGGEGAEAERELLEIVRENGMRMLGPNCMGLINTADDVRLNATFASTQPPPGRVAFLSQSGSLGEIILSRAGELDIGISKFINVGNKADISYPELLASWEDDESVSVILLYLETLDETREFAEAAKRVSRKKPIIAIKAGRTAAGARATVSHTGALAGEEAAVEALFDSCGVVRADSIADMFGLARTFLAGRTPRGNRVAIITNAGGPAVMAADVCADNGLEVVELSDKTQRSLREGLPAEAAVGNPVDILPTSGAEGYRLATETLLEDERVDAVMSIFVPPVIMEPMEINEAAAQLGSDTDKPYLYVYTVNSERESEAKPLREAGIPVYSYPEDAARALAALVRRGEWLGRAEGSVRKFKADMGVVKRIIEKARAGGRLMLTGSEAAAVLKSYGIASAISRTVHAAAEAVEASAAIGYPVVLKLDSEKATHKSDVGGVHLRLQNELDVLDAYEAIGKAAANAGIKPREYEVIVQKMEEGGVELIVGAKQDRTFGPLVLFGSGGVHVEVLKDVTLGIAPLTDTDADAMIKKIRGYPLIRGVRGAEPVDEAALAEVLMRMSQLAVEESSILEVDVNPLLVRGGGAEPIALDARIRIL